MTKIRLTKRRRAWNEACCTSSMTLQTKRNVSESAQLCRKWSSKMECRSSVYRSSPFSWAWAMSFSNAAYPNSRNKGWLTRLRWTLRKLAYDWQPSRARVLKNLAKGGQPSRGASASVLPRECRFLFSAAVHGIFHAMRFRPPPRTLVFR